MKRLLILLALIPTIGLAALPGTGIWEIEPTVGSDTTCAGLFDPSQTPAISDMTATSGTGTAPVVSSASYNFVAGDVGHWLFIKSGTNWNPGWYKISSVAANAATVDATTGHWIAWNDPKSPGVLSSSQGIATVASPTAGSGMVDYTHAATARVAPTDISGSATTTITSASTPFTKMMIGNGILISGGNGLFIITAFTDSNHVTVDRTTGTFSGTTGDVGGAVASPGYAASKMVANNVMWMQASGTASISGTTTNTSAGPLALNTLGNQYLKGYTTYRGDGGQATIQWSANPVSNTYAIVGGSSCYVENIIIDCASNANARGVNGNSGAGVYFNDTVKNCTSAVGGFQSCTSFSFCYQCYALACAQGFTSSNCIFCVARDCTSTGYNLGNGNICSFCIYSANQNGSTGFQLTGTSTVRNCTSVGATLNFQDNNGANSLDTSIFESCLSYDAATHDFIVSNAGNEPRFTNCAGSDSAVTTPGAATVSGYIHLTANPFKTYTRNTYPMDLTPNSTAGGGALLWPGPATAFPSSNYGSTYEVIGAVTPTTSGSSTGGGHIIGG